MSTPTAVNQTSPKESSRAEQTRNEDLNTTQAATQAVKSKPLLKWTR